MWWINEFGGLRKTDRLYGAVRCTMHVSTVYTVYCICRCTLYRCIVFVYTFVLYSL